MGNGGEGYEMIHSLESILHPGNNNLANWMVALSSSSGTGDHSLVVPRGGEGS